MAKYCKLLGSRFWQSTNQSIIYLITHIETFPSNPSIFCGNEFVMHGVLSRKDGFMFDRVQANCCNHALTGILNGKKRALFKGWKFNGD